MKREELNKLIMQACKRTWNEKICKEIEQALSQEQCADTVSIRKDILKCRVGNIVAYNVEWLKKHWQMEMDIVCGVKPCTDAVSRAELLKAIDTWDKFGYTETGCFVRLTKEIDEKYVGYVHLEDVITAIIGMPSVQPSHKGHWIVGSDTDIKGETVYWFTCSECKSDRGQHTNYCPDCGAKMVESQESEE